MFANLVRLRKDMDEAHKTVKETAEKLEKILGAVGIGFGAKELIEKINSVTESMAVLKDSSEKTGASVEALSKLKFFAGTSGKDIGAVTDALGKLSTAMVSTSSTAAPATQALKFLGLNARDQNGNLKDSSVLFTEISKALFQYTDGAGKAALARALFGKSGAEMLPVLKKMAEIGDVEAATTKEQAEAAENYEIKLARLNHQKEIISNTIVAALLPSMGSLIDALIKAGEKTDSLGNSTKKLAEDGHLTSWADSAAMGAARVLDVIVTIGEKVGEIEAPFERYFKASQYGFAAMAIMASNETQAIKDQALTLLREQAAVEQAALKARMASGTFWTTPVYTGASEAVAAAIAARKAQAASGGGAESGGSKGGANFSLGDAQLIAAELKLYENAVKSLENELGKLNDQSALEKLNFEAYGKDFTMEDGTVVHLTGSLEKLNDSHKVVLQMLAGEVDQRKYHIAVLDAEEKHFEALWEIRQKLIDQASKIRLDDQQQIDDLKFSIDLVGKTVAEQERMNAMRQIDLSLRERLKQAADTAGDDTDAYNRQRAILERQAEEQKANVSDLIAFRLAKEREWITGAKQASDDYIDYITNGAALAKQALGGIFKSAEDSAFEFFRHGKLAATNFVDAIKDALARLAAQKFMVNVVGSVSGSALSGAASAAGGMLSGAGNSMMGSSIAQGAMAFLNKGAGAFTGLADGAFQQAGVSMGSQLVADIGNYNWGVPVISGIVQVLSGNVGGGVGSTIGGMIGSAWGPVGTVVGSTIGSWIGSSLFGDGSNDNAVHNAPSDYITAFKAARGMGSISGNYYLQGSRHDGGQYTDQYAFGASQDLANQVDAVFASMENLAKQAGISTDALNSLSFDLGGHGGSGQESFANAISGLSDDIATALIPNIKALQQQGESLSQTFERITAAQIAAKAAVEQQRRSLEIQLMDAQGNAVGALAARREDELAALDATLVPLEKQVYAAQDAATALDKVNVALGNATDAASSAASKSAQDALQLAEAYAKAGDALTAEITKVAGGGSTSGLLTSLSDTLAAANGGDLAALQNLPQAADSYLTAAQASSSTLAQYTREQVRVLGMLGQAQASAGRLGGEQSSQAAMYQRQVQILDDIKTELGQPSPDAVFLQSQVDLLKSVSDSSGTTASTIQGVIDAINVQVAETQKQTAVQAQAANDAAASQKQQQAILAFTAAKSTVDALRVARDRAVDALGAQSGTMTSEDITQGRPGGYDFFTYIIGQENLVQAAQQANQAYLDAFGRAYALYQQAIPGHASGLDRVPYDGYLMRAHKDEAILNASSAAKWRSGAANDNAGEIASLRSEVGSLRQSTNRVALSVERQEGFFRRISPNGDSINVTVAP